MVLTFIFTTHCNVSCTKNLHFCARTKRFNNLALIQHSQAVAFWIFFFFCFVYVLEPSILWFRRFFISLSLDSNWHSLSGLLLRRKSPGHEVASALITRGLLHELCTRRTCADFYAKKNATAVGHAWSVKYISSHLLCFLLTRSCLDNKKRRNV